MNSLQQPFTTMPQDDFGPANILNPLNRNNPCNAVYHQAWLDGLTPEQKESYVRNSLPGERDVMFKNGFCPNPNHRLLSTNPTNPAYHCDEHFHLKWFGNLADKDKVKFLELSPPEKREHNFKKYPHLREMYHKKQAKAKKHEAEVKQKQDEHDKK